MCICNKWTQWPRRTHSEHAALCPAIYSSYFHSLSSCLCCISLTTACYVTHLATSLLSRGSMSDRGGFVPLPIANSVCFAVMRWHHMPAVQPVRNGTPLVPCHWPAHGPQLPWLPKNYLHLQHMFVPSLLCNLNQLCFYSYSNCTEHSVSHSYFCFQCKDGPQKRALKLMQFK